MLCVRAICRNITSNHFYIMMRFFNLQKEKVSLERNFRNELLEN